MIPSILANRRPGGHCYISGTPAEYTRLFGCPPVILPGGEVKEGGGEVIQVTMPSELDTLAGRYVARLRDTVTEADERRQGAADPDIESDYGSFLAAIIRHVARSDRRIGLLNLFWLAHFKTLRACILSHFTPEMRAEKMKYRIWPMLSGFLQRSQRNAFASLAPAERRMIAFNLGRDFNWGIIESLMEDQFALTEADVRDFASWDALGAHNPQFVVDGDVFSRVIREIQGRFNEDLEKNTPDFRRLMRRRTTGLAGLHDPFAGEGGCKPSLFQGQVLNYYLSDDNVAATLLREQEVLFLVERLGGWAPFAEEVERIVQSLQRAEYLQFFQEAVTFIPAGFSDKEIKDLFLEGRLYKYSLALPVVNNFRQVVILFADIREFTRTSEMAISERELTERLYETFDPLVHIINSLGGTVDKFTGDGMMITFGAVRRATHPELRALRCAIAIQEAVERLRLSGRTGFQMGLSLHSGRVFVAEFMHDDRQKETTVIGRQVNLAARLSSTQSHGLQATEEQFHRHRESLRNTPPSSPGAVFMDEDKNFFNVGLATSQQFLHELRKSLTGGQQPDEGAQGSFRFNDRYLKGEVVFHYAGDARFKGFRDAVPVYGVSWKRDIARTGEKAI